MEHETKITDYISREKAIEAIKRIMTNCNPDDFDLDDKASPVRRYAEEGGIMEYKEFKEFWKKANSLKDAECRKLRSCGNCIFKCDSGCCCVTYPEEMTKEQFELIQEYSPVDWSKVPIDTKIVVWLSHEKYYRHFAGFENETVYAWDEGKTSFTTSKKVAWTHAELYQEET